MFDIHKVLIHHLSNVCLFYNRSISKFIIQKTSTTKETFGVGSVEKIKESKVMIPLIELYSILTFLPIYQWI
ncbi:hypothetical protein CN587_18460 [Bacillus wiedmannii]|nr:hypothetical protein CN562_05685 [Bacillus wiedmannii]PEQ03302.1 hypothetical protein CN587_18460 [Bacillus wiedmannii]PFX61611.1 hypothetical protein COL36_10400 [Bacillus wiedmannii]